MTNASLREQFFDPPALLRATMDMLEPEIMFIDRDFNVLYMNKAKRDNWENGSGGSVGEKCFNIFESYGERCPHCVAHTAMDDGELKRNANYTAMRPNNTIQHLNIVVYPVHDEDGQVIGALEICYDVENVYQTNMQLELLNNEYENVIYALSHDLRSPLVSIEGFMRKLENRHLDMEDDGVQHCISRIHANIRLMTNFIKVLLDTSRIARGQLDVSLTDTNAIVDEIMHQFSERAKEQQAIISCDKGSMPTIMCDRVRLMQVFGNLVGNALTHSKDASGVVINIGFKNNTFWVSDNGPGMQEDIKERVFEPFYRGSDNHTGGFGMGLNIAYKIVQKHGGRVWIESSPGRGTCVYFTLKPGAV
ncbi:ATP-binding protein [Candidatus Sumerlaeota bacterium]